MVRVQFRLIRCRRTAAVYVRAHPVALPAVVWFRLRRIPVLTEVNGPVDDVLEAWPSLRPAARLLEWAFVRQLRMSAVVLAVTAGLASYADVLANGKVPTVVVRNAADVDRFVPRDLSSDEPALFFGAFAPWQGLGTLIDAVASPAWPDGLMLRVAGDGQQRAVVEDAVARMPDRVEYVGLVPPEDVPDLVAGSCLVLIPKEYRRSELGLSPIKLYEAMSAGVPVVVSDIPELADTVHEHDAGVVVPAGDSEALAAAVAALVTDPARRQALGRNGRRAAVACHSWSHRVAATESALTRVLADSGAKR